jgi:hypothetical protein
MNNVINELVASCSTYGHVAVLLIASFTGTCVSYLVHFAPKGHRPLHSNIRKH